MTITDKQFNFLVREGYDRTYVSSLTKRQASSIISQIIAEKNSYKLTPYDHDKVMSHVSSAMNEMRRSE